MIPQAWSVFLMARGRWERTQVGAGLISFMYLAQYQLGKHMEMGIRIYCPAARHIPKWTVFDPTRQARSCG